MTVVHHPEPITDEHWQGEELVADDTHRYVWIWQGFNIRLIAVPREDGEWGYDHGWCYPRDPSAVRAAVAAWDPDVQDEPTGWHKRPTVPVRRAPRRDEEPFYNRPRCVHGCYVHEGCRTVGCPESIGLPQTDEEPFGSPGCTCKPWTRQGGQPRYLESHETVDKVGGWERSADCFHHTD